MWSDVLRWSMSESVQGAGRAVLMSGRDGVLDRETSLPSSSTDRPHSYTAITVAHSRSTSSHLTLFNLSTCDVVHSLCVPSPSRHSLTPFHSMPLLALSVSSLPHSLSFDATAGSLRLVTPSLPFIRCHCWLSPSRHSLTPFHSMPLLALSVSSLPHSLSFDATVSMSSIYDECVASHHINPSLSVHCQCAPPHHE